MWENDFGNLYETEEEARDAAREKMDLQDYLDYGSFSIVAMYRIIMKHCPDELYDVLSEAEERYFEDFYHEVEEDEE